ncbi:Hypothetical predicted protein [Cloeon dipterum]|uniref:TIP41-like protein n=1 Tax=Cloeon dipterum TaxID=197152 RepID=A0A8S1DV87_9INSE|nr:Hypothetical predicted protein [Cloeon dipterum]
MDACSSRATPKPRSPSPTARPNVTFHTYACPPAYAAWYCLNGATCFTVRIGESLLYNCECADGYMGQRCEFKDLDGSYLPSRQKVMLEKASIAGGALVAILLVVVVIFSLFVHRASRRKALRAARYATNATNDVVDSRAVDVERRPFSHHRFPILDMSSVAQHHPPCTLGVMPTEVHCTSPSRGATRPMQQLQQVSSVVVHQHSSSHIHPAHHHHHHLQPQQQHLHHQPHHHRKVRTSHAKMAASGCNSPLSFDPVTKDIKRFPSQVEEMACQKWKLFSKNGAILGSTCLKKPGKCEDNADMCQYCVFMKEVPLPHLPDMVFPCNMLQLKHESGCTLEFSALAALKEVGQITQDLVVACSESWKESRKDCKLIEEGVKTPFDWTFSTSYKGSVLGPVTIEPTKERIDIEKLKVKEKILYYQDITLFEDELHDNGISVCTIKIRMMPNSFYLLLRYFLRVDGVHVRLNETRIYHEFQWSYLLREYTSRDASMASLNIPSALCVDPNRIMHLLPLVASSYEKIMLPSTPMVEGESSDVASPGKEE